MITEKELAAYFPYRLKADSNHAGKLINAGEVLGIDRVKGIHIGDLHQDYFTSLIFIKPILFPISSLTKEELRAQGFESHIDYLTHENKGVEWTLKAPYNMVEYLISKKFDVFNMIERGDAIAVTDEFNPYK